MNFNGSTVRFTHSPNSPKFDQSLLNPNNQVALLLPLVVRPQDVPQGSEWDMLPSEMNQKDQLTRSMEVVVNTQLIEENESLKEEIQELRKKVSVYEQLLTKVLPKVEIRDEIISQLESLIDLWKNVDFNTDSDGKINMVLESAMPPKVSILNRSLNKSIENESNELVELISGSNLSLPKQFLVQTREMANDSATYYMRRILAYYFDQETFSKSSARGKGATKSLDTTITNAVWGHTLNQFPNCTLTTLVEDTNRRCAEARRTLNRQSEGRKLCTNRTGQSEQEIGPYCFK